MKIGIVVRILWSAGAQKFAIDQAKALQEAGHEVTILFLRKTNSGDVFKQILNQVNYKIMAEYNPSKLTFFYDFLTGIFMPNRRGEGRVDYNLLKQLPKYTMGMKFDYLICQDEWAGLGGYHCNKKLGTKYAVILHERVDSFPWLRGGKRIFAYLALRLRKKILYSAERVFSLTNEVAKTVSTAYGGELEAIAVFPGLKNNVIHNYRAKKNQVVLISYWKSDKNPEAYIPLFKDLESYHFVIAGNWLSLEFRDKYLERLRSEGVLDKVTFLDNIDEGVKLALLRESKFYVRFGQLERGPGYGTIEALEAGLPIIRNRDLGFSDYLENKSFALVLDNVNETSRVRDFISKCDNEKRYDALQFDIEAMISEFTWQRHASRLVESITGNGNVR